MQARNRRACVVGDAREISVYPTLVNTEPVVGSTPAGKCENSQGKC
jgi:hypothetical protein